MRTYHESRAGSRLRLQRVSSGEWPEWTGKKRRRLGRVSFKEHASRCRVLAPHQRPFWYALSIIILSKRFRSILFSTSGRVFYTLLEKIEIRVRARQEVNRWLHAICIKLWRFACITNEKVFQDSSRPLSNVVCKKSRSPLGTDFEAFFGFRDRSFKSPLEPVLFRLTGFARQDDFITMDALKRFSVSQCTPLLTIKQSCHWSRAVPN